MPKAVIIILALLLTTIAAALGQTKNYTNNPQAHGVLEADLLLTKNLVIYGRYQARSYFGNDANILTFQGVKPSGFFNKTFFVSYTAGFQYMLSEKWYAGAQIESFKTGFNKDFNNISNDYFLGHYGGTKRFKFHQQLVYHNIVKRTSNDKDIFVGLNLGFTRGIDLGELGFLQPGVSLMVGNFVYKGNVKSEKTINNLVPQLSVGWLLAQRINLGLAMGWDRFSQQYTFGNEKGTYVFVVPYLRASAALLIGKIDKEKRYTYAPWGYRGYIQR